eukprot:1189016-Prorocentrum_minimum.AAC.2
MAAGGQGFEGNFGRETLIDMSETLSAVSMLLCSPCLRLTAHAASLLHTALIITKTDMRGVNDAAVKSTCTACCQSGSIKALVANSATGAAGTHTHTRHKQRVELEELEFSSTQLVWMEQPACSIKPREVAAEISEQRLTTYLLARRHSVRDRGRFGNNVTM